MAGRPYVGLTESVQQSGSEYSTRIRVTCPGDSRETSTQPEHRLVALEHPVLRRRMGSGLAPEGEAERRGTPALSHDRRHRTIRDARHRPHPPVLTPVALAPTRLHLHAGVPDASRQHFPATLPAIEAEDMTCIAPGSAAGGSWSGSVLRPWTPKTSHPHQLYHTTQIERAGERQACHLNLQALSSEGSGSEAQSIKGSAASYRAPRARSVTNSSASIPPVRLCRARNHPLAP
jgi:hypothetical protein